jgi:hypothetical protein
MSKRTTSKTNMREVALKNLKKANEARRTRQSQLKSDDWQARSRARLERIIERAERELTKSNTMDGVDLAKLTNALKVCHQAHRAMKDGGDEQFHFRTAAEAHEHLDKTINSLIGTVKRLSPGGKRWVRETMLNPLAKAIGEPLEANG